MRLRPDWKAVLQRAWSIRFIVLAGSAALIEGAVQAWLSGLGFSLLLNLAIGGVCGAAAVARVIAQENLPHG
ncbi:MAG: hypothetical protein J0H94_03840 [Rhizobiales bacterium]|nr:hypothetical protein [Hyphomicrobiales bacterium]